MAGSVKVSLRGAELVKESTENQADGTIAVTWLAENIAHAEEAAELVNALPAKGRRYNKYALAAQVFMVLAAIEDARITGKKKES